MIFKGEYTTDRSRPSTRTLKSKSLNLTSHLVHGGYYRSNPAGLNGSSPGFCSDRFRSGVVSSLYILYHRKTVLSFFGTKFFAFISPITTPSPSQCLPIPLTAAFKPNGQHTEASLIQVYTKRSSTFPLEPPEHVSRTGRIYIQHVKLCLGPTRKDSDTPGSPHKPSGDYTHTGIKSHSYHHHASSKLHPHPKAIDTRTKVKVISLTDRHTSSALPNTPTFSRYYERKSILCIPYT
ncbi:uncharacterized protein BDZ83DRAFT_213849 [Colletotrichum acutatum]|uniref:Uncharacterized protein n=1 Tax=Glomerella acutata TaxID=27357 RepID=A0AAD8UUL1_GLOAC|nr:uncharacterized protein BDZ83DRAFT_213849 [Colletotrichum acutatum]KAK1727374.1 hypothetical protein BDZ83DRAFT_213849 [Colletotrichum acutatum]